MQKLFVPPGNSCKFKQKKIKSLNLHFNWKTETTFRSDNNPTALYLNVKLWGRIFRGTISLIARCSGV